MGFWGDIRDAFRTDKAAALNGEQAEGLPANDSSTHPMAEHYAREREQAAQAGVSVKAYRAGYIGTDETKAALAAMNGSEPELRLVRSQNGLDLALADGRLIDYKTLGLRRWNIFGFRIVGMGFYEDPDQPVSLRNGQAVGLKREPDNEYDPNAVAITMGREARKIGYVNKQRARWIAALLDGGTPLRAVVIQTKAASPRVLIAPPQTLQALRQRSGLAAGQ
jgi:hypothetical protein